MFTYKRVCIHTPDILESCSLMSLVGCSIQKQASAKLILEMFAWVTGEIIICSGSYTATAIKPILFSMKRLSFNNEGIL